MVMFVGQENMSTTELALETARFVLSNLHGLHAFDPAMPSVSRPIDTSEAVRRINDALKEEGTRTGRGNCPVSQLSSIPT